MDSSNYSPLLRCYRFLFTLPSHSLHWSLQSYELDLFLFFASELFYICFYFVCYWWSSVYWFLVFSFFLIVLVYDVSLYKHGFLSTCCCWLWCREFIRYSEFRFSSANSFKIFSKHWFSIINVPSLRMVP